MTKKIAQSETFRIPIERHREVTVRVEGGFRSERIDVLDGDELVRNTSDPGILSMGTSLRPGSMYILEGLLRGRRLSEGAHGCRMRTFRLGFVRYTDKEGMERDGAGSLESQLTVALGKVPTPCDIGFKVLMNNVHWLHVVVRVQARMSRVTLHVSNTTNEFRQMPLKQIQATYARMLVGPVNRAIAAAGGQARVTEDQISYSQGLQFGNMGCGFATARNVDALERGLYVLTEAAVRPEDQVFRTVAKELVLEDGERIPYEENELDRSQSTDRSSRYSRREEAETRARLNLDLARRDKIAAEIASRRKK